MSTAIKIESLYKEYRLGVIGHGTLRQDLQSWWAKLRGQDDPNSIISDNPIRSTSTDRILALKNINLEVEKGAVLGIIGANGAGKSTLLKVLSRVTGPTEGSIKVKGRIASLLEVGTGFHPELTGRENVFLNGAINGMSKKEVTRKFDEIVDFSGVGVYIDTPVKRYSSGMHVRLGFSVAAHLDPEILVVDEVLAVGDAEFQKKCLGKIKDISSEGRTVLFVSHNMASINNLCHEAIVLSEGNLIFRGETQDAISEYLNLRNDNIRDKKEGILKFKTLPNKPIQVMQVSTTDSQGNVKTRFEYSESAFVNMWFDLRESSLDYYCSLQVIDYDGSWIYYTADTDLSKSPIAGIKPATYKYQIELPRKLLKPGNYSINMTITQKNKKHKTGGRPHDNKLLEFEIVDNDSRRGMKSGYRKPAIIAPEINWDLSQI